MPSVAARSCTAADGSTNPAHSASLPEDAGLQRVMAHYGLGPAAIIGHGGEAWVLALGEDAVLRVLHEDGDRDDVVRSHALVAELRRGHHDVALPELLEIREHAGRICALERRLPGHSLLDALEGAEQSGRPPLIEAYLSAVATMGDLPLDPGRPFGDLLARPAITAPTWQGFLEARAAHGIARSGLSVPWIDPRALADALPEPEAASFVHLDAFAGNVLTDGRTITAFLDFSATCAVGDRRLDPVSAVVYLGAPEITPAATDLDLDVAHGWLRAHGLAELVEPARRWLAAYWAQAIDDEKLLAWCRRTLEGER